MGEIKFEFLRNEEKIVTVSTLVLPPHYNAAQAFDQDYHMHAHDLMLAAFEWRQRFNIVPAVMDHPKIHVLGIDMQDDFSFPKGTLFVGGHSGQGAMEDSARFVEWGYRNAHRISGFTTTHDSHLPYQVFLTSAHILKDGSHPAPYTQVSADDYKSGLYRANPLMAAAYETDQMWLTREWMHYTEQLAKSNKFQLTLWPQHTMLGSHGHKLVGAVDALRLFHAYLRGVRNEPAIKGAHPFTENYSVFQPEVLTTHDGQVIAQKNVALLNLLLKNDYLVIAGQAASHCVAWTIRDLLDHLLAEAPDMVKKVYILEDCTSAVVVRDPATGDVIYSYEPDAEKAFNDFRNAGMHVVRSTDPMDTWPGMRLAA